MREFRPGFLFELWEPAVTMFLESGGTSKAWLLGFPLQNWAVPRGIHLGVGKLTGGGGHSKETTSSSKHQAQTYRVPHTFLRKAQTLKPTKRETLFWVRSSLNSQPFHFFERGTHKSIFSCFSRTPYRNTPSVLFPLDLSYQKNVAPFFGVGTTEDS